MFGLRLSKVVPRAVMKAAPGVVSIPKRFGGSLGYSHYTDRAEVESRIMELLRNLPSIPQDKLTPTAHFANDLGIDSLSAVELMFEFEMEFEVEINDTDAAHIETVEEAIEYFTHTPFLS